MHGKACAQTRSEAQAVLSVAFPCTRQGLPCRNADTLKRLQETEKKLKEQQTKAYISMDISNEEREKGNKVSAPITLVNCGRNSHLSGSAGNLRYALEFGCLSRSTADLVFLVRPVNALGFGQELRATSVPLALHGLCSRGTVLLFVCEHACTLVCRPFNRYTWRSQAIKIALHCRPSRSRSTLKQSSTTQRRWQGSPRG